MDWQLFTLLALALYAATQTFTRYEGFGDVFVKARGESKLLNCPVCLGWWLSLAMVITTYAVIGWNGLGEFLLVWFAINAVSIVLNIWSDK